MVLADVTPQRAWEQPVLRFADTVIGGIVGVAAVWLDRLAIRQPGD